MRVKGRGGLALPRNKKQRKSESFEKLLKRLMLNAKPAERERRAIAKENKKNGWPKAFW